jgi:OOP family OmpA-OmpF porin
MDVADDGDVEEFDVNMDELDLGDEKDIDFDDEDLDIDALLKELEEEEEISAEDALTDEDIADILEGEDLEDTETFTWIDEQADDELRKLYFTFNHYGIRPDQKDALTYNIEQVKQLISDAGTALPTVVVEGHACQEGSPSYNVGLSEKRAKCVADLFVDAGIDASLIKVIGRGQECPLMVDGRAINGSREERAPNRRVEVRVLYT